MSRRAIKATFSIVAADPAAGEVGCAVQSRYFAVGTVVPWARAGVGAVATQAAGVAAFGPRGARRSSRPGLEPADGARTRTRRRRRQRETRQLGRRRCGRPRRLAHGRGVLPWAGHRTGTGYAVQGNILAGEEVVAEMERAYLDDERRRSPSGSSRRSRRAQAAGGDARGQQSAAVLVERAGAAAESREGIDRVCDLRVDDHPEPIAELRRLLGIHLVWDVLRARDGLLPARRVRGGRRPPARRARRHGEDAALLYDLACFESLAGERRRRSRTLAPRRRARSRRVHRSAPRATRDLRSGVRAAGTPGTIRASARLSRARALSG